MEMRYEYGPDGRVARISTVDQTSSDVSTYGPEKYVVEYQHDGMGRLARKIVRANTADDTSVHYEAGYQFDGRGRLVNERILRWDDTAKKMRTTQEIRTTYDLGGNPTTIETFNDYGLVVKEERTYARGHQIKSFALTGGPHSTITGATSGNYTYDTNNNLTGTPGTFTVTQNQDGNVRTMNYRQQWTFTYDRKNRMISFAKGDTPTERTNLWYDGVGRVLQRWNDNPQTGDWSATAKRYVYDGSRLVQEHEFDVQQINPEFKEGGGEGGEAMEEQPYWEYTYSKVLVDYLHQPGGLRQYRWDADDEEYKTEFLSDDAGLPGARIERGTAITSVPKAQRIASGDRQADAEVTEFNHLSNVTVGGGFVEGYGSTSGATEGFDALQQVGNMHYLAGLENALSMKGDSLQSGSPSGGGGSGSQGGSNPGSPCPDCCWDWLVPVQSCMKKNQSLNQGHVRQCWYMMCCDCYTGASVGVYPCGDPNNNCDAKCCKDSVFNQLPLSQAYSSSCGSSGMCWAALAPSVVSIDKPWWPWAPHKTLPTYYDIAQNFARMCQMVMNTGCLGLCSRQSGLCACFKEFCNCTAWPGIHVWWGGNKTWPWPIPTIFLEYFFTERDILHELVHYCHAKMHLSKYMAGGEIYPLACEKLCEGGAYVGLASISPCCCADNPPPECSVTTSEDIIAAGVYGGGIKGPSWPVMPNYPAI